jgi:hypothetical protein
MVSLRKQAIDELTVSLAALKKQEAQQNLQSTVDYLDLLPGVLALWWFMENVNDEHPHRSELFFYCRERVRRYETSLQQALHDDRQRFGEN